MLQRRSGTGARRKEFLAEASLLPISGAILELAGSLVGPGLIPAEVAQDAIHVAAAAVHGCSFLLTWNFRHLANAAIRSRIDKDSRGKWLRTPHNLYPRRTGGSVKVESRGRMKCSSIFMSSARRGRPSTATISNAW